MVDKIGKEYGQLFIGFKFYVMGFRLIQQVMGSIKFFSKDVKLRKMFYSWLCFIFYFQKVFLWF